MGLRLQGLIWILLLCLGLGWIGLDLLTRQLADSFEALEQEQLQQDMRRLQTGLEMAVNTRLRTTREWGQWSDLRDHVLEPGGGFRTRYLTPRSVQASGFDWLVLLDRDGSVLDSVASDDRPVALASLLDRGTPRAQRLLKMPPSGGLCALDRWLERLLIICQQPVRDTEAREEPVGILLTGETFDDDKLDGLRRLLGHPITLSPGQELPPGQALPGIPGLSLSEEPDVLRAHWLLRIGDEAGHTVLRMDWPRALQVQRERALAGGRAVLIGLSVALALAVLVLIDLRLVQRLRRLQRQLAQVRGGEQWTQRLRVGGRDEVAALAEEGNHLLERIETQMGRLEALSRTDALTGLANRRGFEERLQQALLRARRSGEPLALLLLDVDHFKRFNDQHGHPAGDRALQILAQGMREAGARRGDDLAARWGGEEFVLLLEGCSPELAVGRFAALQAWLRDSAAASCLAAPMTVSAGLALARAEVERAETLLQRADDALYRAKQGGRNRVEMAA